jgi:hypothetical protein
MIAFKNEPEMVLKNGKLSAVIINIKDYQELLERAEDAEDTRYLNALRKKQPQYRTLSDFLAETK